MNRHDAHQRCEDRRLNGDLERIREALACVPPDDREVWVKMGMAIKSELGETGRDLWDRWSQESDAYHAGDAKDVWRSIKPNGDIGIGTLFYTAKQYGWHDSHYVPPAPEAIAEYHRRQRAQAETDAAEIARQQVETASKARSVWQAATAAKADHPYLVRKSVQPTETLREIPAETASVLLGYPPRVEDERLVGRLLVVPILRDGHLRTLELIDEAGRKAALAGRGTKTGGYWATRHLPDHEGDDLILQFGEGVATVLTGYQATGHLTIATLALSNMSKVLETFRARFPTATFVVLAERDKKTGQVNPMALKAARTAGAWVAVPAFGPNRPEDATDFNDLALAHGLEAVRQTIEATLARADARRHSAPGDKAEGVREEWPPLVDLSSPSDPFPYPIEAFPETAQRAITEFADYNGTPVAMVAGSALFQMALAVQGLADVARNPHLSGPTSLYVMTFEQSGGRKSHTDRTFGRARRAWVRQVREARIHEYRRSRALAEDYRAALEGVKAKIKHLSGKDDDKSREERQRLRDQLIELEQNPVVVTPLPDDLPEEFNSASLAEVVAEGWPSTGTSSDEAGILIGSQGFAKEHATGLLAALNRYWDGTDYIQTRKSVKGAHVTGRRFSCNLLMQPELLEVLIDRGARHLGFLARFLLCRPVSILGTRFYREPPATWPALDAFEAALLKLLNQDLPIDRSGKDGGALMRLKPPLLRLSPDAKARWIAYHDAVEAELAQFGEFAEVADIASKSAENAARIAAVFQVFAHGKVSNEVGPDAMEGGIAVAAWYLTEARRLFLDADTPTGVLDARELSAWFTGKARELTGRDGAPLIDPEGIIALADISHRGPNRTRDTLRRDEAIERLVEAGHVRRVDRGKRRLVQIRPELLGGAKH